MFHPQIYWFRLQRLALFSDRGNKCNIAYSTRTSVYPVFTLGIKKQGPKAVRYRWLEGKMSNYVQCLMMCRKCVLLNDVLR